MVVIAGSGVRGEIIDRVLAVVDRAIITQSDVLGVIRLGIERAPQAGDPVQVVLDRLIERRLMLAEVDRYAPPEPPPEQLNRRLEAVRGSFATPQQFEAELARSGLDIEQLRRHLRDDLRIDAHLQQRFGASLPTEAQILEYYRANPDRFTTGGVLVPFNTAHDVARAAPLRLAIPNP